MFIATAIVAVLEPRLALLLFLLLLLAAAAPIVVGWLSLLPAEREPFAVPGAKEPRRVRSISSCEHFFQRDSPCSGIPHRSPVLAHHKASAAGVG